MKNLLKFATPIAEVFAIIIVGNVVAGLVVSQLFDPALMSQNLGVDTDFYQLAKVTSTSMLLRFGSMIVIAFFVFKLWHRSDRKQVFKTWGLSTGRYSISKLFGMGVLLYAVTLLPLQAIMTFNEFIPIDEGLPVWEIQSSVNFRPDFLVLMLLTSVLIPPLLEETIARGYTRSRIADMYGPIGGIMLSAIIFTLAHGQYFKGNLLLLSVLPCIIYATIGWAFVTWKTGSIIPAIVAHAIMNTPFPRSGLTFSIIVIVMVVLILLYRKDVKRYFNEFFQLWKNSSSKGAVLLAALCIALILTSIVLINAMTLIWLVIFIVIAIMGHVRNYSKPKDI